MTKRCLERMATWRRLVEHVIDTEFPDWELLGAFSIFRLEEPPARSRPVSRPPPQPVGTWASGRLGQLAWAFGVDPTKLHEEFLDHQRLAQRHKNMNPSSTAAEAWKHAVMKTQKTERSRSLWSVKALLPILERFFVAPGSTAGIEQTFSLFKHIMGEQWHGSEDAEERLLVLTLRARRDNKLSDELLVAARRFWGEYLGPARSSQGVRLGIRGHVLVQRTKKSSSMGAAGWLAQRRLAAAAAGAHLLRTTGAAQPSVPHLAVWTKKHEREVQHQKVERQERACAAVEEGTVSGTVACGDEQATNAAMLKWRAAEAHRARTAVAKERKQKVIRALPKPGAFPGMAVWLDKAARQELDRPAGEWFRLCQLLQLRETQRHLASILVVTNPAKPGDRNGIVAAMLGQALCTPCHLLSGTGPLLRLCRAVQGPRYILVSAACQARYPNTIGLMKATASSTRASRWKWFAETAAEQETFLRRAKQRGHKHNSELVTLVLESERARFATSFPRVMTLRQFCNENHTVDPQRSLMGVCQR